MSIVLDRITKRYGKQLVVDRISLEIAEGELFVLLGPSGSGKSTVLRIIAGLTLPDQGRVLLGGRDVTSLPPQKRGTGFVFQNYSIFRHMTVAQNIEFGLKIRKIRAAERRQKRESLLEMVGLAGLDNRLASQLSGGQQQRVALARALAYEPDVLLLDEPFGALDAKIRSQLRRSLREIQQKLHVTAILVTHDQEEAFELADRIGAVDHGRLVEAGSSQALYSQPRTLFTATFLGAGTVLVGHAEQGRAHFGPLSLPIPDPVPHEDGSRVRLLFRPEQVILSETRPAEDTLLLGKGTVTEQSFRGGVQRVRLSLPRLPATRQIAPPVPFGEDSLLVDTVVPADHLTAGKELWVSLGGWHILEQPRSRLMVFDNGSGSIVHLQIARWLAERLSATVTLLGVAAEPGKSDVLSKAVKRRQEEANLLDAELRVRSGDPAEQIASELAETLYDLVIATRVPRRFFFHERRGDSLGAVLLKILEQTSAPVLVVKEQRAPLSRVLICTAAGEPGKNDVRVGGRLARRLGAEVTLLHVTNRSQDPSPLARTHLQQAVATLRAADMTGKMHFRQAATPSEGILAEAREGDYDVIVVGGHAPRARPAFRLNDVTRQVLAGTGRPVLVVPQEF